MRKIYKNLFGEYPDRIINKYKNMADYEPARTFYEWKINRDFDLIPELKAEERNQKKAKAIIDRLLEELSEFPLIIEGEIKSCYNENDFHKNSAKRR